MTGSLHVLDDQGAVRPREPGSVRVPSALAALAPGSLVAVQDEHPGRAHDTVHTLLDAGLCPLLLGATLPKARALEITRRAGAAAWVGEAGAVEEVLPGPRPTLPDGHVLVVTSGSTSGRGSVLALSVARAVENARAHFGSLGLDGSGQTVLLPMPLTHAFGFVVGSLAARHLGHRVVHPSSLPAGRALTALVERERVDVVHLTPSQARATLARATPMPAVRVATLGSAPVSQDDAALLARAFPNARRFATYGLTECGPRVATADLDDGPTVGAPLAGVTLEVRAGELHVRTPYLAAYALTEGHYEPLDAAAPFPTRDAATVDERGRIVVLGRLDGVVNRGGTNVYPEAVEAVARALPGVLEACVVGRPSKAYGAVPVLVVELAPGTSPESLEPLLHASLTPMERPVRIVPHALPRTALGKVARSAVASWLETSDVA